MIQQFFYLLFLTIIYWSLPTYSVLGCNNDCLRNQSTDNNMNLWIFISMLISILTSCLTIYYYHKQQTSALQLSNETNIIRNVYDLPNFQAIKPYITIYIHRAQAQFILDDLISEAKQTNLVTIVPKINSLHLESMFIHVEFIQDTQTIIALIEYADEADRNSRYFFTLRRLFVTIFEPSRTIQTWGNIVQLMRPYVQYGLFSLNEVLQSQCSDIQKQFKLWYNRTFRHHTQCRRYLRYDEIDGSLCSCEHRPYKSTSDQWSISRAVVYTFDEQFSYHVHGLHRCFAVTKLAHVVSQRWTIQQLKDYKQKRRINQ